MCFEVASIRFQYDTNWPVARDFRPSGEKSVFEKMAIKIVVKNLPKKLRGVNDTVLLLDMTGVLFFCFFALFVSHLTLLVS